MDTQLKQGVNERCLCRRDPASEAVITFNFCNFFNLVILFDVLREN
jgi:hypothetical protein